jgi:hypothetical protein
LLVDKSDETSVSLMSREYFSKPILFEDLGRYSCVGFRVWQHFQAGSCCPCRWGRFPGHKRRAIVNDDPKLEESMKRRFPIRNAGLDNSESTFEFTKKLVALPDALFVKILGEGAVLQPTIQPLRWSQKAQEYLELRWTKGLRA